MPLYENKLTHEELKKHIERHNENVHSPYCQYCFDQPFDTEKEYFENEYCNERCKERYEEEKME
jgi:hypothetical protein